MDGWVSDVAVNYMQALKWPIIGWVVVDVIFIAAGFWDALIAMLFPAAVSLGLAFGAWTGYKMIAEFRGTVLDVAVGGIVVGAACGILTVVYHVVHGGAVTDATWASGVSSVLVVLFGAVVGGGFALTSGR